MKNRMELTLTLLELTTLFSELLKREATVHFCYITKDNSKVGIRYCLNAEGVYYNENEIELIFNSQEDRFNSFTISVPEEKNIICQINHGKIEKTDYEESDIIFEEHNSNKFQLYFDNFSFEIFVESKEFYGIIADIENLSKKLVESKV